MCSSSRARTVRDEVSAHLLSTSMGSGAAQGSQHPAYQRCLPNAHATLMPLMYHRWIQQHALASQVPMPRQVALPRQEPLLLHQCPTHATQCDRRWQSESLA